MMRIWTHLSAQEVERRLTRLNKLYAHPDEELRDSYRVALSLRSILEHDADDLSDYASADDWPYGRHISWLSERWGRLGEPRDDGTWPEADAARLSRIPERFEELAAMEDANLWTILVANPACHPDLIDRLARSPEIDWESRQVWYCAAENPGTWPSTLMWLIDQAALNADDEIDDMPSSEVIEVAFRNPALAPERMTFAGLEDEQFLRAALAANSALPAALYEELSNDASEVVRAAVAKNPCAAESVVRRLRSDASERVQAAAEANLNL